MASTGSVTLHEDMALIPSTFVVFVVVAHEGHVLLIREAKHGQRWYAPAGRLESGESIREAAIRETQEEAGVLVEPTGLLRVDQHWHPSAWWRFVVAARVDPRARSVVPKQQADAHSIEARWVWPDAIAQYPLRGDEVHALVALGLAGPVVPLA